MEESRIFAAYCDGGVIASNPSPHGGTWAYVLIGANDEKLAGNSGVIRAPAGGTVTNNYSELYAALKVMQALPDGWDGTIYTDSLITLRRITTGNRFTNIPFDMEREVRRQRSRLRNTVELVSGHPTLHELRQGRTNRGTPVSVWNVVCDEQCGKLARAFLTGEPPELAEQLAARL